MSEYDHLLGEVKEAAEQFRAKASEYVPRMYNALVTDDNLTPKAAKKKIETDLEGIWSIDTIRHNMPIEAKNQAQGNAARKVNKEKKEKAGAAPASEQRQELPPMTTGLGSREPTSEEFHKAAKNEVNDEQKTTFGNPSQSDLKERLSNSEARSAALEKQIVDLEEELVTGRAVGESLKTENEYLKSQVEALTIENEKLKSQPAQLAEQNQALKYEVQQLQHLFKPFDTQFKLFHNNETWIVKAKVDAQARRVMADLDVGASRSANK